MPSQPNDSSSESLNLYECMASVLVDYRCLVRAESLEQAESHAFGVGERLEMTSIMIDKTNVERCILREIKQPEDAPIQDAGSGKDLPP